MGSSFFRVGSQNTFIKDSFLSSDYFNPNYLFARGYEFFREIFSFLYANNKELISGFHFLLSMLVIFFVVVLTYSLIRIFEIRSKEHKHLQHEIEEYAHHKAEREKKAQQGSEVSTNPRWVQTLNYLFSPNASDWKLAIIEADAMLEALLDQLGFKGETLGDKLKNTTQEKFRGLSSAWEVHGIRNRIAHEGLAYEISQYEAKRVIAIYEQIFRVYGFI